MKLDGLYMTVNVLRKPNEFLARTLKAWGHEKFFSRWCNATCSIPPTQEKKCVSHDFNFCFMGQKVREIPERHADFVPGTMEQN